MAAPRSPEVRELEDLTRVVDVQMGALPLLFHPREELLCRLFFVAEVEKNQVGLLPSVFSFERKPVVFPRVDKSFRPSGQIDPVAPKSHRSPPMGFVQK
jgi:hypothetical protein